MLCLDSRIPLVSISKISSLYLASVAAQAGFESTLVANPVDRYSCDEASVAAQAGFESTLVANPEDRYSCDEAQSSKLLDDEPV